MLTLQLLSMFGYCIIAFQDIKDREVTWMLFPFLGSCLGLTYGLQVGASVFTYVIMVNLILTTCVLLLLYAITKLIFKKPFLDVSFGLGDLLFLYVLALGFPTMTFVYILVGSLLFSLMAFFLMKILLQTKTVPLAGLMGIFLMALSLLALMPGTPSLYAY